MAAKVVMVAVPTVLGIASIRVYTVSEASTGGLVTREKLNIYTPLLQSAQDQFIPERPGVIERRLTTVRESILPFFQAVQGAFVSVKRGSVNLYHAGEDVYYYLKDPPPGFLPRFGTINMAGLLGMFLARKGSRFKRIALPLGLMSAGASVCYPAQTVAVLKVTGKKVYAAGQWSSTAVSSLLISKSREPATKEIAAAHPQAATVPNTESAVFEEASEPSSVQSATVPETEVELALSVPVSDEHIVTVITEEASSVTLTELSPDQTSTETIADPVAHSVPAETETTTTSGEIPAPVESEEPSDTKNAAEDVSPDSSPAKQTLSSEPEIVEAAPVEVALVESAVPLEAEAAPVEAVPSSEEPPAPKASVPVVESGEPEPAVQPELADPPQVAAVEETLTPTPPQQSAAEISKVPAETETTTTSGEIPAPVESEEPSETKNAAEDVSPDSSPAKQTLSSESEIVEAAPVEVALVESAVPLEAEAAPVEAVPSSEEPPAPKASDEAAVPVVESGEPEPAVQPELADPPQVAAVEETLTPTPPQQSAAEISKGGTGFKPDPAVMDFGQSNPEDEDLYSTRS